MACSFIEFNTQGQGEMAFGALKASIECSFTASGVDFEWNGVDEGDQVSGGGWAHLRDDGCLEGEIAYENGDETTFIGSCPNAWCSLSGPPRFSASV